MKSIFEVNKNPHRIIELLSMIAGEKILPEQTLVIFDEIQECPEALNTLKYFYEHREGARARDFEEAIEWLVSAGMLNRVYNVSKMEHPLSAFDKLDCFKLFVFDTGLLKHMAALIIVRFY